MYKNYTAKHKFFTLFLIFFPNIVQMITDLQPNLQHITYVHGRKSINKMLFSYIEKMSLLKQLQNVTLVRRGFCFICVQKKVYQWKIPENG